ncbi:NAD(P)H oxidoreductase [Paenibacillus sp. GCM10012307]|uniref:NAD(P)H oxidoreductase n=1 Tax=Paenibacillus roseus TaxID=2798579 RepID=A0A934MTK7_9BACL|nr:NAD(P)H oxidoreductase [Paenibacillus roseus]MBJ6364314.1 NAD(P)H oxidoreductase [Paenibacillus roseus]
MKVLVVASHPRQNSLTLSIARKVTDGLVEAGHEFEFADLYTEQFNPLLYPPDEPDWANPRKTYSPEVQREIQRIQTSDAIVFVFPVWWYGLPAMLKGYIDRVWNYGFAYGDAKIPISKVKWIGLVGETKEQFAKRECDVLLNTLLNSYIASFCGVEDSTVHLLYNTVPDFGGNEEQAKAHYDAFLSEARRIGLEFEA